jgi:hypothetical protein
MGSAPMLAQTPAPWAQTGGPGELPTMAAGLPAKRSAVPVVISVALVAVLGIGGVVAFKAFGKSAPADVVVSPTPTVAAPGPAETHKSEPMAKPAEPTAKPGEPSAAESAPAASSAAAAVGIAGQVKRPVLLTAPAKRAPGAPPVAAAPPAAAPPPAAPPPAAPAATATGRKIRTEL